MVCFLQQTSTKTKTKHNKQNKTYRILWVFGADLEDIAASSLGVQNGRSAILEGKRRGQRGGTGPRVTQQLFTPKQPDRIFRIGKILEK